MSADSRKTRTWMAKIIGTHPVYKLDRSFMNCDYKGSYGEKVFRLDEGYYEAYYGKRRQFIHLNNRKNRRRFTKEPGTRRRK
ncbi:hypothetical protein [Paenibacillus polymyxa]|uniref:hypothetical protein n=1 Tax=Paenibacillus polymyxa TaxID=1406 RepID=UPI0025CA9E89|nr:hypothetical protein [Paenibacillus polymyxa]